MSRSHLVNESEQLGVVLGQQAWNLEDGFGVTKKIDKDRLYQLSLLTVDLSAYDALSKHRFELFVE